MSIFFFLVFFWGLVFWPAIFVFTFGMHRHLIVYMVFMVYIHGLYLWFVFVDCVCGLYGYGLCLDCMGMCLWIVWVYVWISGLDLVQVPVQQTLRAYSSMRPV